MPAIRIPSSVLSGFKAISELEPQKAKDFGEYLSRQSVGAKIENIYEFLSSELSVPNSRAIVQTLVSFSELFEQHNQNLDHLAEELGDSYAFALEGGGEDLSKENKENLVNNLSILFKHSENFRIT